ncbi:MAG: GerMN domain-containing protein [Bacillota bacterium]
MKRLLTFFLIILFIIGIAGCSTKEGGDVISPVDIVEREIEQMPEYMQSHLEELRNSENYFAFNLDDGILLFASRGLKNTGGYTISFAQAGIQGGKLYVQVITTDPKPDENVTQALTYPYALSKAAGNNLPDKVVFIEGEDFKNVLKEITVTEMPEPEESVITLYFGTQDGYLRKEPRAITGLPTAERGKEILEEVIKGSQSMDDTLNVLPQGTKVLNYKFEKDTGLAVVDLSDHVHAVAGSMGETLAVYSIVNTLTELPGIEKVMILVEGKEVESLSGHVYLGEPLKRDLELLEGNILK